MEGSCSPRFSSDEGTVLHDAPDLLDGPRDAAFLHSLDVHHRTDRLRRAEENV
jgi:hypothetical protein